MHSVLWNFVDAASGRFLMEAEKLVQRSGTLSDLIRLFDRFRHVSFCENHRLAELLPERKLRDNRR